MAAQLGGAAQAVDADDVAEVAGAAGLHAGELIFEDAACSGSTPTASAAARYASGAGLPADARGGEPPSMRASKRSAMPADASASAQCLLDETTAVRRPASRAART